MYLLGDTLFFLVWLAIFWYRCDARKEILSVSVLFGIAGLVADFVASIDYWTPPTITGTRVGIESFLYGFSIGGIASAIYIAITKRRVVGGNNDAGMRFILSIYVLTAIFLTVFLAFGMDSFYANIVAFLVPTCIMLLQRKDLLFDSLVTGILLTIIGIVITSVLLMLQPTFIQQHWKLDGQWYMRLLFGIPLGEYIFYLTAGMFIGPFYEYWHGFRLKKMPLRKP